MNPDLGIVFKFEAERVRSVPAKSDSSKGGERPRCDEVGTESGSDRARSYHVGCAEMATRSLPLSVLTSSPKKQKRDRLN